jgi:hypothetical protein
MPYRETITVHCENSKKTNALCDQKAKFLNVTAGGAYGYHWPLNG